MSTETDLKALEKHRSVIDPACLVYYTHDGQWPHWVDALYGPIPSKAAWALRIQQAMDWLKAWCESKGKSYRLSYSPLMGSKSRIEVRGGGNNVIFDGGSDAIVLAAAIEELEKEEVK